jgi:DNA-binding XRE family transcriptional regulator
VNKIKSRIVRIVTFFVNFTFLLPQKESQLITSTNRIFICVKLFLTMNTNKILSKIRTKRHALNYSQEYMALLLKMKQSNYNKIENGKVELSIPIL